MKENILLIEDDNILGSTLMENLQLEGYGVHWIKNGNEALKHLKKSLFDLIVLDLQLPEKSGFEILKALREQGNDIPVLIISAKSDLTSKTLGFELKADDYLCKPFHLKELFLRIKSLRRRALYKASLQKENYKIGKATISLANGKIQNSDSQLTPKELRLIKLLIAKCNHIVSRDEIINTLWSNEEKASERSIDNMVLKIRKLIEPNTKNPQYIQSHRGIGYSLNLQEK